MNATTEINFLPTIILLIAAHDWMPRNILNIQDLYGKDRIFLKNTEQWKDKAKIKIQVTISYQKPVSDNECLYFLLKLQKLSIYFTPRSLNA